MTDRTPATGMATRSSRGVRTPGGAQAAVPSELPDGPRYVLAPGDHGQAKPPAVAVKVAADFVLPPWSSKVVIAVKNASGEGCQPTS